MRAFAQEDRIKADFAAQQLHALDDSGRSRLTDVPADEGSGVMLQLADRFRKREPENHLAACRFSIEPKAIVAAFHGRTRFLMAALDCETLGQQGDTDVAYCP